MNRELNDKAEKFASQWCLKNEDYRAVRLAFKAGFCESQKLKDQLSPYSGLVGIFKRVWLTWHKARFDSLEALYLHVFLAERQIELDREKAQEARIAAIKAHLQSKND